MSTDFVNVPVPRDRVLEVYELLARPAVTHIEPVTAVLFDAEIVSRAYRESSDVMKKALRYLAENPSRRIPMTELAAACGYRPQQMSGALGAFGHRWSKRYHGGKETKWPFNAGWDYSLGMMVYEMSPELASFILSL